MSATRLIQGCLSDKPVFSKNHRQCADYSVGLSFHFIVGIAAETALSFVLGLEVLRQIAAKFVTKPKHSRMENDQRRLCRAKNDLTYRLFQQN